MKASENNSISHKKCKFNSNALIHANPALKTTTRDAHVKSIHRHLFNSYHGLPKQISHYRPLRYPLFTGKQQKFYKAIWKCQVINKSIDNCSPLEFAKRGHRCATSGQQTAKWLQGVICFQRRLPCLHWLLEETLHSVTSPQASVSMKRNPLSHTTP